ncbi:unnamed protein product [Urochloa decumbens]|uniref:3-beta hydroxysteroid dehydrogenase/isomerase domain-containing protein n=1 Tax=Urochloa decumbens TaxID=240449 RepID=A0ABC8XRR3_9POAL
MGSQRDDGSAVGGRPETRWCAVTGGRGFMARHLVAALLRSGEWRVRVTDLAPAIVLGPGENEALLDDALRDGRAVYASVDICNLDQVTKGTKNVIDACKICKVKRLIHTSSSAVVFDGVHGLFNVNESLPYPDKFPDAYAQTKAEAEKLVMKANGIDGLLTCCIRPGSIFGPGDIILPTLDRYGRTHFIVGNGKNCDDFVYVENVVHGHICANRTLSTMEGAKKSGGKAYFITNMEPMNMWDFTHMVQEELGYKRPFKIRIPLLIIKPVSYLVEWGYKVLYRYGIYQPQLLTPARVKYTTLNRTFSCNRAIEELGYKPTVPIMDGLKTTVESYIRLKNKVFLTER